MSGLPGFTGKRHSAESRAKMGAARIRHGYCVEGRVTPEYNAFIGARDRCTNPKHKNWKEYGGRGIRFLFSSPEQWLAELGPRPSPAHSVDRIENDGHYSPGNVRWATRSEQRRNRRRG